MVKADSLRALDGQEHTAPGRARVLFILPGLEAGGAERVLIALMNGIDRQKYQPVFLSVHGDGPLRRSIDSTIPYYSIGRKLSLFSLPKLFAKIRNIKPDIVVSTMAHMNFAVLALAPLFPKTSFIVREAITPSFFARKGGIKKHVIKALYRILYPRADAVISPSQKIFEEFRHDLNVRGDNFVLIKNPVDHASIRDTAQKATWQGNQEKGRVRFVACGRLHRQKGFDRLIKALSHFNAQYPWRLDILGQGEEKQALEALILKTGLQDKVFLKGLVMPPYKDFAQADCFLMSSYFEGLPNVVLEALACGTPVIATQESGGIVEIAEDCPPGSVTVVHDMQAFLEEMGKVTPAEKEAVYPSMLAQCYYQEKVIACFERVLNQNIDVSAAAVA